MGATRREGDAGVRGGRGRRVAAATRAAGGGLGRAAGRRTHLTVKTRPFRLSDATCVPPVRVTGVLPAMRCVNIDGACGGAGAKRARGRAASKRVAGGTARGSARTAPPPGAAQRTLMSYHSLRVKGSTAFFLPPAFTFLPSFLFLPMAMVPVAREKTKTKKTWSTTKSGKRRTRRGRQSRMHAAREKERGYACNWPRALLSREACGGCRRRHPQEREGAAARTRSRNRPHGSSQQTLASPNKGSKLTGRKLLERESRQIKARAQARVIARVCC